MLLTEHFVRVPRQDSQAPACVQVYAPKLVVIYIGSNDLSAAQCDGGEDKLMAAVPGIVSRYSPCSCSGSDLCRLRGPICCSVQQRGGQPHGCGAHPH